MTEHVSYTAILPAGGGLEGIESVLTSLDGRPSPTVKRAELHPETGERWAWVYELVGNSGVPDSYEYRLVGSHADTAGYREDED